MFLLTVMSVNNTIEAAAAPSMGPPRAILLTFDGAALDAAAAPSMGPPRKMSLMRLPCAILLPG